MKNSHICSAVLRLVALSCPTLCNSLDCSPPGSSVHGDSPGKNTGVGCHALLQGIFPTLRLNPGLPQCGQILYHLSHQGAPGVSALKLTYCISWLRLPSQNTTDDGLNNRNSFFSQIWGQKPKTKVLARLAAPEGLRENLFLGWWTAILPVFLLCLSVCV